MQATVPDYVAKLHKPPLSQRINFRLIAVAVVVLLVVGYPVYTLIDAQIHGGIKTVGDSTFADLKALGNFPFDEANGTENDVPANFRALDGKRVVLEGFQYPTTSNDEQVPEFQFVYNIQKCCFGGPPKVQERVFGHAPQPGGRVPMYYPAFARIEGILHVRAKRAEGKVTSLYDMDVQKVTSLNN